MAKIKIRIKAPIIGELLSHIKSYFYDMRLIFSTDFRKENYDKHLFYTAALVLIFFISVFKLELLLEMNPILILILGGFIGFTINFTREWVLTDTSNAPFSNIDVKMGSYGGLLGGVIFIITNHYNIP